MKSMKNMKNAEGIIENLTAKNFATESTECL
jgi:hypothetical protein